MNISDCSAGFSNLPIEIVETILERAILSDPEKSTSCFLACIRTCKAWYDICEGYQLALLPSMTIQPKPSGIFLKLCRELSQSFQPTINQIKSRKEFALALESSSVLESYRQQKVQELSTFLQKNKGFTLTLDSFTVDFSIEELIEIISQMPNLRELKINAQNLWCSHTLTTEKFEEILKQCPQLTSLEFQYCPLPSEAFEKIAEYCPKLRCIYLKDSENMDGQILSYLAKLPLLEKIHLPYGKKIQELPIDKINPLNLPWKELDLSYCAISSEDIEKLNRLSPDLQLIVEQEEW